MAVPAAPSTHDAFAHSAAPIAFVTTMKSIAIARSKLIMAKSKKFDKQTANFEQALAELEALVAAMESGELTLEESLQAFEAGVRLTRECQQTLQQAEQKVQLLLAEDGTTTEFPNATDSVNGDTPQ